MEKCFRQPNTFFDDPAFRHPSPPRITQNRRQPMLRFSDTVRSFHVPLRTDRCNTWHTHLHKPKRGSSRRQADWPQLGSAARTLPSQTHVVETIMANMSPIPLHADKKHLENYLLHGGLRRLGRKNRPMVSHTSTLNLSKVYAGNRGPVKAQIFCFLNLERRELDVSMLGRVSCRYRSSSEQPSIQARGDSRGRNSHHPFRPSSRQPAALASILGRGCVPPRPHRSRTLEKHNKRPAHQRRC